MSETDKHPYETPRGECSELPPPMNHSHLSESYFQGNRVANTGDKVDNSITKQGKAVDVIPTNKVVTGQQEKFRGEPDYPAPHAEFPLQHTPSESCSTVVTSHTPEGLRQK